MDSRKSESEVTEKGNNQFMTCYNFETFGDKTTRKPCYCKDDRAMRPIYKLFTLILFTLMATIYFAWILILSEFQLRKFCDFCKSDVSAVQGHPR